VTEPVRLRSPQVRNPVIVKPEDVADPQSTLVIQCRQEQFQLERKSGRDANGPLCFQNPNPFTVQLILERIEWTEDILTAAQVTSWQEFRDLFVSEVICPDEQITVGSQIVLFTDLRGSTAMYNGIGDAPAYVVVRDHFVILTEAIREHHGAIVKTIGDAVMAVFSRVDEALAAVRQMHERLGLAIPTKGLAVPLMLKSSLHLGPCLAVNANDKLDYFGTTVNLAARMVGCCQGGDLTISDEVHSRTETSQFLAQTGKAAHPSEVQFKGFEKPARVWRIPMV
jgi:class 3 adenylate cyclase